MERFLFVNDGLPVAYAIIDEDQLSLHIDEDLDPSIKDELMDRINGLEYPVTLIPEKSVDIVKLSKTWEKSQSLSYEEIEI